MSRKNLNEYSSRSLAIYIHVLVWVMIFAFPLLLEDRTSGIRWESYLWHIVMPVAFFIVFYINYGLLVPYHYMRKRRSQYIIYNIILIVIISSIQHGITPYLQEAAESARGNIIKPDNYPHPPRWIFIARDLVMLAMTAGLAATIRMSSQWQKAETARQEAERNHIAAELNNLRNQLNPHFLLNTLNNIYALITFDSEKAQQAVQDLSKLLRYVLYENQGTFVPLYREINFIQNYIELMRIRLRKDVRVDINIQINKESQTPIAPLLFISLIENAFKHGISPTAPSFISITIYEDNGCVHCEITNSNHPKTHSDKSGSGIGLEQVKKRLELIYPNRYTWEKGICADGSTYISNLTIQTRQNNKKEL